MENLKIPFKISGLIFKYLQNNLNEDEDVTLQKWINSDPLNRELFDKIAEESYLKAKLKTYESYDKDVVWANIKEEIEKNTGKKKNKFKRIASIAAAVLIPFVIGAYFIYNSDKSDNEELIVENTEIIPGSQKAILTLENGEQIVLDENRNELLISDKTFKILNEDKTLKYESDKFNNNDFPGIIYNTLKTPKGGEYALQLSDGTKIWLNADSKLTYPALFMGNTRVVTIEGEAYFDVSEDASKPFIVKTQDTEITVLGTEFNITAYSDDTQNLTTLTEGKIKVRNLIDSIGSTNQLELTPGQQAVFKKDSKTFNSRTVNTEVYTAWRKGLFYFEYETLGNLMKRLGRWYDFETKYTSEELRTYHFSGTIKRYESFDEIIELLELTTNISFKTEGKSVTVSKEIK